MCASHERQRPRSIAYDRIGTLSYQAIWWPQAMQAEAGLTSDFRRGIRAATTFRKEPSARPGARAIAARPMSVDVSAAGGHFVMIMVPTEAPVFGGSGAPTGMFVITGNGMNDALLNELSNLPMLIGPSTVTPFFTNVIVDEGWLQSDPWNVSELLVNVIEVTFDASATSVGIELFPLDPCQAPAAVLHGVVAQRV